MDWDILINQVRVVVFTLVLIAGQSKAQNINYARKSNIIFNQLI